MPNFPPIPTEVKHIAHFFKVADEHDSRNIVISYWCRMYACQVAMKSVPGKKPPEVTALLIAIMDWLEQTKKENPDNDGITNETCAQALIEEYAIQLFTYADKQDAEENFGKNMVKAFYTSGILMDVLQQFGTLSEDIFNKRKYAKWKAAYIHNCLKTGEQPLPGPPVDRNLLGESDEDEEEDLNVNANTADNLPVVPPNQPVVPPSQPGISPNQPNAPDINIPIPPLIVASAVTPQIPRAMSNPSVDINAVANLDSEQIAKAQKYCKFAGSALDYDDTNTAIDNLQKALYLLQFGKDM